RDRAAGREALAGFDFGSEAFEMSLRDGQLRTIAVKQPDAPFVLKGNGNTMASAVYGTSPLPQLIAKGHVGAEGDLPAAQNFLDLFRLEAQF
ncbi:transcriptional regulator, partial [Leisingera daeponensis]|nr:transcriptional regulator [Leisingera daeponensis]MBY6142395.1 transcriptional regulator [Leisingera daeponensis]